MKVEDLVQDLKQDYTIVMVTHNMQQATRVSDKTAFFLLGEVVEFNETSEPVLDAEGSAHRELYHRQIRLMGG